MDTQGALKITTPSEREIVMTRVFNAPRHLVFEAFIKPEHLRRWLLGPPGWQMTICEAAAKVGDSYHYAWRHADGQTMSLHGVCREFVPPERIVNTEHMQGFTGESLVTTVFVEEAGKTTLTTTVLYESREVRDVMITSGMERGVAASYERLADLLAGKENVGTKPPAAANV